MADDPRRYESEVIRVRNAAGTRWAFAWIAGAVLVIAVGLAGTAFAPPSAPPTILEVSTRTPAPAAVIDTAARTKGPGPAPVVGALPPLDITSGASGYAAAFEMRRRQSLPLVVESTDFYANSGAAYYGIGGKLIRALRPTPSPAPATR